MCGATEIGVAATYKKGSLSLVLADGHSGDDAGVVAGLLHIGLPVGGCAAVGGCGLSAAHRDRQPCAHDLYFPAGGDVRVYLHVGVDEAQCQPVALAEGPVGGEGAEGCLFLAGGDGGGAAGDEHGFTVGGNVVEVRDDVQSLIQGGEHDAEVHAAFDAEVLPLGGVDAPDAVLHVGAGGDVGRQCPAAGGGGGADG